MSGWSKWCFLIFLFSFVLCSSQELSTRGESVFVYRQILSLKVIKSPEVKRVWEKVPLCVPYSVLFPKHLPCLRIGCTNRVACSYSLYLVGDKKEFTSVYTNKGKNPFGFPAWFQAVCQAGIRRTGVLPASHRYEHPERQRCSVHTSWCDALSSPLRRHLHAAGCPSLSPGCRDSCILIPHSQAIEILGMS